MAGVNFGDDYNHPSDGCLESDAQMSVSLVLYVYVHMYMHPCMHPCMHACMHVRRYVYLHMYTFTYACLHPSFPGICMHALPFIQLTRSGHWIGAEANLGGAASNFKSFRTVRVDKVLESWHLTPPLMSVSGWVGG